MKEKPILFSAPMVRAILEGRKTQTRRVIKFNKPFTHHHFNNAFRTFDHGWGFCKGEPILAMLECPGKQCPYGQPGDRLWVRETWAHYQTVNYIKPGDGSGRAFPQVSDGLAAYKADGFDSIEDLKAHIRLMSDSSLSNIEVNGDRWRPSIHMPRWASRITLEIVNVRVERVQEIDYDDAHDEGVCEKIHIPWMGCKQDFQYLWDSINAERGYEWDKNPWVWCIEFKRVTL